MAPQPQAKKKQNTVNTMRTMNNFRLSGLRKKGLTEMVKRTGAETKAAVRT